MTAGLLLGLILAQSAAGEAAPQPDLERIRRALAEPASSLVPPAPVVRDGPIFRMRIDAFELGPAWTDRGIVPPYVRTWFRLAHHEHMEQVTPVEFRAATLNPYGIPVDAILYPLVKQIKAARRASQQKRARDDVGKALAAFLACRAEPSRTGCSQP